MDKAVPAWAARPAAAGRLHLLVRKGGRLGDERIEIEGRPGYLLGRHRDCDVTLEEKTVSRAHACIAHHLDGRVLVVDLKSVHGTFVDGRELPPGGQAQLVPGQTQLRLGACPWTFSLEHGPASAADARPSRPASQAAIESNGRAPREADAGPHERGSGADRDRDREHRSSRRSRGDADEPRRRDKRAREPEREARDRPQQRDGDERSKRDSLAAERQARAAWQPAADPAAFVRSMAGAPGGGGRLPTALEQKKRLLWGGRAADVSQSAMEPGGANHWENAEFASEAERAKFQRLMGVQAGPAAAGQGGAGQAGQEREAMSAAQQERVLAGQEGEFLEGLRRQGGRRVGLGL